MRLHVIQHVPFEGPAAIAQWAVERGHQVTTSLALLDEHPPPEHVDFLVILGGPMSADDETVSPWLPAERHFIAGVIVAGRPVLGVCLGAQILAEVIGGTVRRNELAEIGWFPVERTPEGAEEPLFSAWGEPVVVGQWHRDTFDLPAGLESVLSSEACRNQAFVFDQRVVGLQFHLEWTGEAIADLVAECGSEPAAGGSFVMTAEQIAEGARLQLPACRDRLFTLLDGLSGLAAREPRHGTQ